MAYEQFINGWEDILRSFYADVIENTNGTMTWRFSSKEKEKMFNNNILRSYKNPQGKVIKGLSICNALLLISIIDDDDFEVLKIVHDKRNAYVHEFPCMNQEVPDIDKKLFTDFLNIRSKALKNWIIEIEIPTNSQEENSCFLDSDGCFVPPKDAFDIADLYFKTLCELALYK